MFVLAIHQCTVAVTSVIGTLGGGGLEGEVEEEDGQNVELQPRRHTDRSLWRYNMTSLNFHV